jgi:hypothetical protein
MFFVQVQSSSPPWRGAQRAGWLQCKSNSQLNFPHLRYTSLSVGTQSAGIVPTDMLTHQALNQVPLRGGVPNGRGGCNAKPSSKPIRASEKLPTPNSQLPTFFISKSSKTSRCSFYSDKHTIHTLVHFHW